MSYYRIKFPGAKDYVELESHEDVVGFARVLQLGYGIKPNRNKCELLCNNDMDREIILSKLCDIDIENANKEIGYSIQLSLPGTDRWFSADREDILYARILTEIAYGCVWTPDNVQIKIDDPELSRLVDEAICRTNPTKFNSVVSAICGVVGDTKVFNTPFCKAKRSVEILYEK